MTRAVRGLLFTAARVARHNGVVGFVLKDRQYEQDLWRELSTEPSMSPHTPPRLRAYGIYPRLENARTNIFTINPAFYPTGRIFFIVSPI